MDQPQEELDEIFEETTGDDVWSEEGWYFDLPAGAWERQEAKNRALRDNIRANVRQDSMLRAQDRRKKPFDVPNRHDLGGWADGLDEPGPNGRPVPEVWGEETGWDGTAAGPVPAADAVEKWETPAPDPMTDSDWDFRDSPLAASPRAVSPLAPGAGGDELALRRRTAADADPAVETTAEAPRTRWDEMFGGPDSGSVVGAMREWSEKGKEEQAQARDVTRIAPELLEPFDWELDSPAATGPNSLAATEAPRIFDDEPEPARLEIVDGGDLDPASWSEFAATAKPGTDAQPKKGGLLSRVFPGRKQDDSNADNPDWVRADGKGWAPVAKAEPAGAWEPADSNQKPSEEPQWAEGRDDDTPFDYRPSTFATPMSTPNGRMKGLADDHRASSREVRSWGATPTDEDGSVQYDLPKRFGGRNVWDDGWLERPVAGEPGEGPAATESPAPLFADARQPDEAEAPAEAYAVAADGDTAPGAAVEAGPARFLAEAPVAEPPAAAPADEEFDDGGDSGAFGTYFDEAPPAAVAATAGEPAVEKTDPDANGGDADALLAEAAGTLVEIRAAEEPEQRDGAIDANRDGAVMASADAESAPKAAAGAKYGAKYEESRDAQEADRGTQILHAEPRGPNSGDPPEERVEPGPLGSAGAEGAERGDDLRPAKESKPPPDPGSQDPWAAFLVAQESGGTHPFVSPATGMSGEPVSWNNNAKPGEAINADMTSKEPASGSSDPKDDRWAEIVAAAGYEENPTVPIYTGRREPSGLDSERRGLSDLLGPEPGPAARPAAAAALEEAGALPLESIRRYDDQPAWGEEDDVVLRAFEEHARAEPVVAAPMAVPSRFPAERNDPIDELLGADAEEIVDEAMSSPVEGSAGTGRNVRTEPMPWEDPPPSQAPTMIDEEGWDPPPPRDEDERYEGEEPYYVGALAPGYPGAAPPADPVESTMLRSRKRHGRTVARELVETLLLALLVFLAVRASFQNFKVDGNSMYPTLENGEFLIVNKLIYSEVDVDKLGRFLPFLDGGDSPKRFVFHGPQRGDIVVLRDPRQPEVDLIKRVIALPGETIEIVNGTIFVNGMILEEPYITQPWHYTGTQVVLGAGEYFVMGDNRDNSKDSRSVGAIPKELIIGKAMLTYWPASDFGRAPNQAPRIGETTIAAYREANGIAAVSGRP